MLDDEQLVREVWGGMLGHLGYKADFASDAVEAIEKFVELRKHRAAIVEELESGFGFEEG